MKKIMGREISLSRSAGRKDKIMVLGGYGASAILFILVLVLFMAGIMAFSRKAEANGAETLQASIQKASVQCYAIEGRYPPSVEYLEENYGIQIDRNKYSVFYSGFASNVMPDITVVKLEPDQ